jgi:hypothetical protein
VSEEKKPRRRKKAEMAAAIIAEASAEPAEVAAVVTEETVDGMTAAAVQDQQDKVHVIGFTSDLFSGPEERKFIQRRDKLEREMGKVARQRDRCHKRLLNTFRRYDRLVNEYRSLEQRAIRLLRKQPKEA